MYRGKSMAKVLVVQVKRVKSMLTNANGKLILFAKIFEMKSDNFYHLEYSDNRFHFYCYTHISGNISFGFNFPGSILLFYL